MPSGSFPEGLVEEINYKISRRSQNQSVLWAAAVIMLREMGVH